MPFERQSARSGNLYLIIMLLSLFMLTACGHEEDKKAEEEDEEVSMPVRTTEVTRGDISAFYPTTTTLESEYEASVVAKVGGVVEKFYVEEGDLVKSGAPLVQIETDRLRLELNRSESELKKMKNELDRTAEIYKKQLVSSEAYEKLKFEYESRKASYELSKLELDFATVIAPIDGIISKRYVKVGNMVNRNEPVYHITDFDPLHAVIYVPEKELNKIALNQVAKVQVDAQTDKVFEGFVKRISPIVDANSGTFKVTIEVQDPERRLKPGMFGRLVIIYDERIDTILVDKRSVLSEDTAFWVFVVREGRAVKQMITPGYVNEEHMEVMAGLEVGDIVVNMGQNSLKDNSLVEIIEGPGKPEAVEETPEETAEATTNDQVVGE